jgi:hypothetical protein
MLLLYLLYVRDVLAPESISSAVLSILYIIQLSTSINLKLKAMWYNKVVYNECNNEIDREKYFVKDVYELYGGMGKDICGNYILEFWSED